MSEKNEATETKETRFNFTVEGMETKQAQNLMGMIRSWLATYGLELGGGFMPYKDEPDPRDAVVEAGMILEARHGLDCFIDKGVCQCGLNNFQETLKALEASDVEKKQ